MTRFLLVSNVSNDPWHQNLAQALSDFGALTIHGETTLLTLLCQQEFAFIIIDAAEVDDPSALVASIRSRHPQLKIIVATAAPTWKHARDSFYAGANDYIRKFSDEKEILTSLQAILVDRLRVKKKRGGG